MFPPAVYKDDDDGEGETVSFATLIPIKKRERSHEKQEQKGKTRKMAIDGVQVWRARRFAIFAKPGMEIKII